MTPVARSKAPSELMARTADSENSPEEALSLSDIKQAKGLRKQEKARQQARPLSLQLVANRNLQGARVENAYGALKQLQQVEVDRERIGSIPAEVASALESVKQLHLQHNCFVDMRSLGSMPTLRYLLLAHNSITEVSGIRGLKSLAVLDLSDNLINNLDAEELPQSLQVIQLAGNPIAVDQQSLFTVLARALPLLSQVDDRVVPPSRQFSDSISSGGGTTNRLVEAALEEIEEEEIVKPAKLSAGASSKPEGLPSPIRVTPAASRQGSADLGPAPTSNEVRTMLARVREALPTVREAADVGISDSIIDMQPRRSLSTEGLSGFRRMKAEDAYVNKSRATSLPPMGASHPRIGFAHPGSGQSFPLTQPPPNFKTHPQEFQDLLSGALGTLAKSRAPGRGAALLKPDEVGSVWAQTQQHRQQVLDSLFAKRQPEPLPQEPPPAPKSGELPSRLSLRRQDSTISKHRRGRLGSTVNEEMLQGLQIRDRPRAEGLSEAMQGPPAQPPSSQLAALSQDTTEEKAAENARMSLRWGIHVMLESGQKRRASERSSEAAVVSELNKLKKMTSLQGLLAMREAYISPQPQVLASIVGSHSRLGSITDRLVQKLHAAQPSGESHENNPPPLASATSSLSTQHQQMSSPFESHPSPGPSGSRGNLISTSSEPSMTQRMSSPFEGGPVPKTQSAQEIGNNRQFLVPTINRDSTSSSSSSGTEGSLSVQGRSTRPSPWAQGKIQSIPEATASGPMPMQRKQSSRRRLPEPSSPGSDPETDPNPPLNRHSARPTFGGIARLVRGPSGQMEPPPSPVPTSARAMSGRLSSGKLPQSNALTGRVPAAKPTPLSGSGAVLNLSKPSPSDSDSDRWKPPRGGQQKLVNINRAQSSQPRKLDSQMTEEIRKASVLEALEKEAKFQAELWARFSGGAGSAAKDVSVTGGPRTFVSSSSPFSSAGTEKQPQFLSPFSAGNTPSMSPFGQPAKDSDAADARLGLGEKGETRGKSWHQGDVGTSPFARTHLPFISRPGAHLAHPDSTIGQSAPPLPASDIDSRMMQAQEFSRGRHEAVSAPADVSLRQALRDALAAHEEEMAAAKEKGEPAQPPRESTWLQPLPYKGGMPTAQASSEVQQGGPQGLFAAHRHSSEAPNSDHPPAVPSEGVNTVASEPKGSEMGGQRLFQRQAKVTFADDVAPPDTAGGNNSGRSVQ